MCYFSEPWLTPSTDARIGSNPDADEEEGSGAGYGRGTGASFREDDEEGSGYRVKDTKENFPIDDEVCKVYFCSQLFKCELIFVGINLLVPLGSKSFFHFLWLQLNEIFYNKVLAYIKKYIS